MAHWTYETAEPESDLQQGDLLEPTIGLQDVLKTVHPHFCADKYLGFCVTTQSCDLVRRKDHQPKAHYVSVATIRSLDQVFPRLVATVGKEIAPGVFKKSDRNHARQMLERLIDQNEQGMGLFYLHPDADFAFGEPAVAFLRVSVALRSEHYPVLVEARRGRLTSEFRAKFGWLVGNLYSRAATHDWSDSRDGHVASTTLIQRFLDKTTWVEDLLIDAARGKLDFSSVSKESLVEELEKYRPSPPIELAANEVSRLFKQLLTREIESLDERRVWIALGAHEGSAESA